MRAARACDSVRRFLAKADTPHLSARRERLPAFDALLAHAARLFGADGLLRDDASPALAGARAKLRRRRTEVSRQLEKILGERHEALGDAVVVMRNDRYCLPVLASSRGRVPGIVHDRSGSGQTVFVEPLEVIEANNDLALLAAEERREIERLLGEFGRAVLGEADRLLDAVDALAALDALEAKVAFGEMGEGRLPEIADDGNWTLVAARHPLLDARFEKLRRRVLGESRERSDAVALDFALPGRPAPARRLGAERRRQDRRAEDGRTLLDAGAVRHPDPRGRRDAAAGLPRDPHRDRRRAGDPVGPVDVLVVHGAPGRHPRRRPGPTRSP